MTTKLVKNTSEALPEKSPIFKPAKMHVKKMLRAKVFPSTKVDGAASSAQHVQLLNLKAKRYL